LHIEPTKGIAVVTVGFLPSRCCKKNQFAKFGRPFSLAEQVLLREIQSNTIFDPDPLIATTCSVGEGERKALLPEGEGSLGNT
jgi:hypothetical protein